MKKTPREQQQQQRLLASKISSAGFMGDDERPWEEIVAEDTREMERLGCDTGRAVQRLRAIDRAARRAPGEVLEVAPGINARHYEAMGRIPSPFPGDGVFPKGETRITWDDGRGLRITALGLALIENHGFFQGRGSPFRIDPRLLAELLAAGKGDAGRGGLT